jgi:MATE family multidrug resistance protein
VTLVRRIAALAWPVLISQAAVVLSGTIDTIVTGHASTDDLAAMAVGSSIYSSVYVGMMGVVMALNPIVANRIGAGDKEAAGRSFIDGLWLAAVLSVVAGVVIGYPAFWVNLSHVSPAVGKQIDGYLRALVFAVPAALLFRTVYAFNTAISRPKVVMMINLIGLIVKLPLDIALVYGKFGFPEMGATGCAVATAIVMWVSCAIGLWVMLKDQHYRVFQFRFAWPHGPRLKQLLMIGVPSGMSYIVEVTAFTSMAIIAARLGAAVTGGHQIAANIAVLCYMVPLGLSIATATLAAQSLGAKDAAAAQQTLKTGTLMGLSCALVLSSQVLLWRHALVHLYTSSSEAEAIGVTLLGFVALFHIFDALQSVASFTLRAYGRTLGPMLIDALMLWGVGLAGGVLLAFHSLLGHPPWGIDGLWIGATLALGLVAASFLTYALHVAAKVRRNPALIPAMGRD